MSHLSFTSDPGRRGDRPERRLIAVLVALFMAQTTLVAVTIAEAIRDHHAATPRSD